MTTERDVCGWAVGLEGVVNRIAPRFGRAGPRRRARACLRGLLAPVERKNGWQLAEAAGDATPDGVREFLGRVRWDAVRGDLQAYVAEQLGDPGAALVLDGTGFLKKGAKSAGVQRRYTGTAGRIENAVAKPDEVAFHLTHPPQGTSLADLVRVAGARWSVESLFEPAKGEVGLDQYEVRSWAGWHRHIALSMFALAYLAVVRRSAEQGATGGADPANLQADLLPLTVPEVRRLIAALVLHRPPRPDAALQWPSRRRQHQQRAKRAHWHRRTRRRSSETRL